MRLLNAIGTAVGILTVALILFVLIIVAVPGVRYIFGPAVEVTFAQIDKWWNAPINGVPSPTFVPASTLTCTAEPRGSVYLGGVMYNTVYRLPDAAAGACTAPSNSLFLVSEDTGVYLVHTGTAAVVWAVGPEGSFQFAAAPARIKTLLATRNINGTGIALNSGGQAVVQFTYEAKH